MAAADGALLLELRKPVSEVVRRGIAVQDILEDALEPCGAIALPLVHVVVILGRTDFLYCKDQALGTMKISAPFRVTSTNRRIPEQGEKSQRSFGPTKPALA